MTTGSLSVFVIVGVVFGLLAAACAFVIAFAEYEHHFPGTAKPLGMALQAALVTLAFFLLASLCLPWLLAILSRRR
jgi:hypothetical protein